MLNTRIRGIHIFFIFLLFAILAGTYFIPFYSSSIYSSFGTSQSTPLTGLSALAQGQQCTQDSAGQCTAGCGGSSAPPIKKISPLLEKKLDSLENRDEKIPVIVHLAQGGAEIGYGSEQYSDIAIASVPADEIEELSESDSVYTVWADEKVVAFGDFPMPILESSGGSGTRIALLDTGINLETTSKSFVGSGPEDRDGHGTTLAKIILETDPDSQLLNAKVLDDTGSGYMSDVIRGIFWALDPDLDPATDDGAQIITLALGAPDFDLDLRSPVNLAVRKAMESGVVVIAASGNCGDGCFGFTGVTAPGSSPHALTVGAVDENKAHFSFSGGGTPYRTIKPDVVSNGQYSASGEQAEGTSVSAARVAGLTSLLLEEYGLTPHQIKTILTSTAEDLGEPGPDTLYGHGLADPAAIFLPKLTVTPSSISEKLWHGQEKQVTITLSNAGGAPLYYNILPLEQPGELFPANSRAISFSLPLGADATQADAIQISSNGGDFSIPVSVETYPEGTPFLEEIFIPRAAAGEELPIRLLISNPENAKKVTGRIGKGLFSPKIKFTHQEFGDERYWAGTYTPDEPGKFTLHITIDSEIEATQYSEDFEVLDLSDARPPALRLIEPIPETGLVLIQFHEESAMDLSVTVGGEKTAVYKTSDASAFFVIAGDASLSATLDCCDEHGNCISYFRQGLSYFNADQAQAMILTSKSFGSSKADCWAFGGCLYFSDKDGIHRYAVGQHHTYDLTNEICTVNLVVCDSSADKVCREHKVSAEDSDDGYEHRWGTCHGTGGGGGGGGPSNQPTTFTYLGVDRDGDFRVDVQDYTYSWPETKPLMAVSASDGDGLSTISAYQEIGGTRQQLPTEATAGSKWTVYVPFCVPGTCPDPIQDNVQFHIEARDSKGSTTTFSKTFPISTSNIPPGLTAIPRVVRNDSLSLYYFSPQSLCNKDFITAQVRTPNRYEAVRLFKKSDCLYMDEYYPEEKGTYRVTTITSGALTQETSYTFYNLDLEPRLDDAFRTPIVYKQQGDPISLVFREESSSKPKVGAIALDCEKFSCSLAGIEPTAALRQAENSKILATAESELEVGTDYLPATDLGLEIYGLDGDTAAPIYTTSADLRLGDEIAFKYSPDTPSNIRLIPFYYPQEDEPPVIIKQNLFADTITDPSYLVVTNRDKLLDYYLYHAQEGTYGRGDLYIKAALTTLYENSLATRTVVKDISHIPYPWDDYEEYTAISNSLLSSDANKINDAVIEIQSQTASTCPTCQNTILLGNDYVVPNYLQNADGRYRPTDKPYSNTELAEVDFSHLFEGDLYLFVPSDGDFSDLEERFEEDGITKNIYVKEAADYSCSDLSEVGGLPVLLGNPENNHLLNNCFDRVKVSKFNKFVETQDITDIQLSITLLDAIVMQGDEYLPRDRVSTVLMGLAPTTKMARHTGVVLTETYAKVAELEDLSDSEILQKPNILVARTYDLSNLNTKDPELLDTKIKQGRDTNSKLDDLLIKLSNSISVETATSIIEIIDSSPYQSSSLKTPRAFLACIFVPEKMKISEELVCNMVPFVEIIMDERDMAECVESLETGFKSIELGVVECPQYEAMGPQDRAKYIVPPDDAIIAPRDNPLYDCLPEDVKKQWFWCGTNVVAYTLDVTQAAGILSSAVFPPMIVVQEATDVPDVAASSVKVLVKNLDDTKLLTKADVSKAFRELLKSDWKISIKSVKAGTEAASEMKITKFFFEVMIKAPGTPPDTFTAFIKALAKGKDVWKPLFEIADVQIAKGALKPTYYSVNFMTELISSKGGETALKVLDTIQAKNAHLYSDGLHAFDKTVSSWSLDASKKAKLMDWVELKRPDPKDLLGIEGLKLNNPNYLEAIWKLEEDFGIKPRDYRSFGYNSIDEIYDLFLLNRVKIQKAHKLFDVMYNPAQKAGLNKQIGYMVSRGYTVEQAADLLKQHEKHKHFYTLLEAIEDGHPPSDTVVPDIGQLSELEKQLGMLTEIETKLNANGLVHPRTSEIVTVFKAVDSAPGTTVDDAIALINKLGPDILNRDPEGFTNLLKFGFSDPIHGEVSLKTFISSDSELNKVLKGSVAQGEVDRMAEAYSRYVLRTKYGGKIKYVEKTYHNLLPNSKIPDYVSKTGDKTYGVSVYTIKSSKKSQASIKSALRNKGKDLYNAENALRSAGKWKEYGWNEKVIHVLCSPEQSSDVQAAAKALKAEGHLVDYSIDITEAPVYLLKGGGSS